ncbi:phosphotransferase enzyme family protein [Amycolatopsis anabasis]|uniref:phosphotransferase enzyme family protein n=1 Tax=Amycolatopsis anabasis TaxID=1840409 RepID=UPI0015D26105|nr:phosphotransferase [Amycolatopsis anabasis]
MAAPDRTRYLARAALSAYNLPVARLARLPRGFNTTFRVDGADGHRYVLRIQRPDGPDEPMVRAEMTWLTALRRDTGLLVPEPVPTRARDLLTVVEDAGAPRCCVLYRWVAGRFLDRGLTPARLHRVGAFTARLHRHGAGCDGSPRGPVDNVTGLGGAQRRTLSAETAADAAQSVRQAHSPAGGDLVHRVLERVRRTRDALGRGPDVSGLVHADLHQENYLFHQGEVGAIDFDDCGHGHFAYDLAVTVSELDHLPGRPALRAALLAGYRTVRPLPAEHEAAIDDFVALRRVQLLIWAVEQRHRPELRETWSATVTRGLRKLENYLSRAR